MNDKMNAFHQNTFRSGSLIKMIGILYTLHHYYSTEIQKYLDDGVQTGGQGEPRSRGVQLDACDAFGMPFKSMQQ